MKLDNPLVSIIIPTYNRAHLIGETLDSVLAQTYKNWECIVVDDGSTDYTDELLGFYTKKDSRIQYHHRPTDRKKGANACRNFGFELSRGGYINWLDSDDLLHRNKLDSQTKCLVGEDIYTLSTSKWESFSNIEDINYLQKNYREIYQTFDDIFEFFEAMSNSYGFLPSHSYLMHRNIVEQAGNWLPDLQINQDAEFFSRALIRARKVKFCSNSMVYYRNDNQDTNRVSTLKNRKQGEDLLLSWHLIESSFKIRFRKESNYIRKSKLTVYNKIKTDYPNLISSNRFFFDDIRKTRLELFKKKLMKLKNWLIG